MEVLKEYRESSWAILWHRLFRKLIGSFIVVDNSITTALGPELMLTLRTFGGTLSIYVQEIRYKVVFKRWYIRNKHFVLYKFSTYCSDDVSQKLREATSSDVYFPDIQFRSFSRLQNKRFLFNAYLDVILERLKRINEIDSGYADTDVLP